MMKRVADIIAEELAALGLKDLFMLTGGGAMHLNDAFGRCRKFNIFFNHHEQASAMAAESYARLSGRPAVLNVTTGPGGLNALNGVYGAYVDSIPMVIVSGQIKRQTLARNFPWPIRQLGDQEVDIISMVRPITKYAVELQSPNRVKEIVSKAVYLAVNGRPGPVWIDVPLDVQGAMVDENLTPGWRPDTCEALLELRGDVGLSANTLGDFTCLPAEILKKRAAGIAAGLNSARRPVLMGGTGVRLAGGRDKFLEIAEKCSLPAVGGWNAYDLIPTGHPCYAGRPGTIGDRAGNFTVQNADFLLVLGCRLNIRQISYGDFALAPKAWKVQVDIDPSELHKPTLAFEMSVQADLKVFLPLLLEALENRRPSPAHLEWLRWCRERVERYPVLSKNECSARNLINPYFFMDKLFARLGAGDVVVAANATAAVTSMQCGRIADGLRLYSNSGAASMGYDLPAAIGAAIGAPGRSGRIICLAGDGSVMMNLQELQTIVHYQLPIIIYILNNNGYHSIRQTQRTYFPDNLLGLDPSSGLTFPDYMKIAADFGLPGRRISNHAEVEDFLDWSLAGARPACHEIRLDPSRNFEPKLSSRRKDDGTLESARLEDMAPFLTPEELHENLI
jgi:acetolactate synthase-1/2/3 large subunit